MGENNKRIELAEQKFQIKISNFEKNNYFVKSHDKLSSSPTEVFKNKSQKSKNSQIHVSGGVNIATNRTRVNDVGNFWGPMSIPEAPPSPSYLTEKPKNTTTCPITGNKLK